jgi:hypothetical protein
MKEPEDEAFEDLAKRQGYWNMQGSRKHQIAKIAHEDVQTHPAEFAHLIRNDVIEEIAQHLETKFTGPFGRSTVESFSMYIRGMKK